MTFDRKAVGDYVRKLIDEREPTQSDLARHLNIAVPSVNKWVNGNITPHNQYWPAIEDFYGLPSGMLMAIAFGVEGESESDILAHLLEKSMLATDDRLTKRARTAITELIESLHSGRYA